MVDRKTRLLFMLLLGYGALANADSAFDGTWTAEVIRPSPAPKQNLTISLMTTEGKVSGAIKIEGGGEYPIEWGITKGDLITFKVQLPFTSGNINFVHLGQLNGDKLNLGRRPEDLSLGRLVEFVAARKQR